MKERTSCNIFESSRGGPTKAFWIYRTFNFWISTPQRIWYIFSGKDCLSCAMQEISQSFWIWEEYLGERFRKMAMEWDHRDREPCLSPAAFVNQVQYSNILEGRFKQLQGKSHSGVSMRLEGKLHSVWSLHIHPIVSWGNIHWFKLAKLIYSIRIYSLFVFLLSELRLSNNLGCTLWHLLMLSYW